MYGWQDKQTAAAERYGQQLTTLCLRNVRKRKGKVCYKYGYFKPTRKAVYAPQVLLSNMPGIHILGFDLTEDFVLIRQRRGALEVSSCMVSGISITP